VNLGSPQDAAPRTDLPYLRHRRLVRAAEAAPLTGGDLLDLAPAPAVEQPRSRRPPTRRRLAPARRVTLNQPLTLTPELPTVVLTRLQSAVGTLETTFYWSQPVGGRLLVAYQKKSREIRIATPTSDPVDDLDCFRLDHRHKDTRLSWDLLHVRDIDRLMLATGVGPSAHPVTGVLTLVTHSGARIEVPTVSLPQSGGVTVLVTIYNVDGELVIRAEHDKINGTLKTACAAYGYDRLTWIDDYTPVQ
jgi:hypothetical protein